MALVRWQLLHPRMTVQALGFLPQWLDDADPRGAADQLDSHYRFGGFKQYPVHGFKARPDYCLFFPRDPIFRPLACARLRREMVCLYVSDFVAVWQPDGSFVCARFD